MAWIKDIHKSQLSPDPEVEQVHPEDGHHYWDPYKCPYKTSFGRSSMIWPCLSLSTSSTHWHCWQWRALWTSLIITGAMTVTWIFKEKKEIISSQRRVQPSLYHCISLYSIGTISTVSVGLNWKLDRRRGVSLIHHEDLKTSYLIFIIPIIIIIAFMFLSGIVNYIIEPFN